MLARFTGMRAILLTVLICSVLGAGEAAADPVVLATTTGSRGISARGGWVVWSAPTAPGRWGLSSVHAGVVTQLAVQSQTQPIEADLGSDSRGRVVATYSRCTRTALAYGPPPIGCRIHAIDLATRVDRLAGVPRRAGASDTSPSMFGGKLAFARTTPHRRAVMQVMLWSPAEHRLTRLRHGVVPTRCPFSTGCAGAQRSGQVLGLDLGRDLVAFRWAVIAPAVVGHVGFEVRADRLRDGRSILLGSGFGGEACTGGIDGTAPRPPVADGPRVLFLQTSAACEKNFSDLWRGDASTAAIVTGALPETVIGLTYDAGALYAIVAPPKQAPPGIFSPVELTCSDPGAPCSIVRLDLPALRPLGQRIGSPVY